MHKSSKRKNFSPTAAEEHRSTLRVAVSHQLTTVQQADAVAQKAQVAPGTDEDQKYISQGEKKSASYQSCVSMVNSGHCYENNMGSNKVSASGSVRYEE